MRKISAQRVIGTLVLLLFAALVLLPLFWLGVSAFKSDADVIKWPPIFFPTEWVTTQFAYVWKVLPIARMLLNTVVFAGGVTIISLFFDSMAAYAFARMKFTGRKLLFGIILLTMMIPFQVVIDSQCHKCRLCKRQNDFQIYFPLSHTINFRSLIQRFRYAREEGCQHENTVGTRCAWQNQS